MTTDMAGFLDELQIVLTRMLSARMRVSGALWLLA